MILNRLKRRFPFRRVIAIFHDGGVTQRKLDVALLLRENEFRQIFDFSAATSIRKPVRHFVNQSFLRRNIIDCFKLILLKIGFVGKCDTQTGFEKLRPWVLEIRGHYTKLVISNFDFASLIQRFPSSILAEFNVHQNNPIPGLHFRLGDLLSLTEKEPISSERVRQAILMLKMLVDLNSIQLFSDSLPVALSILNNFDFDFDLKVLSSDTSIFFAFIYLVRSSAFIATPSKVSEWVVLFRYFLGINGQTLIPKELVSHFKEIAPEILNASQVYVY